MSTNIDIPFFPEENLLQDLANRLFKDYAYSTTAVPLGGQYLPVSDSRFGIPVSAGGAGISPASFNAVNEIDLKNRHEVSQDKHFPDNNKLPQSVAGSGISPSAHNQGNEVNLENPQTALRDPHFPAEGKIPPSVAGSGISPSILSFDSGPQIPFYQSGIQNNSYYFLKEPNQFLSTNPDPTYFAKAPDKTGLVKPSFEVDFIKKDFPILQEKVNGKPLIWLDNAATTQKPKQVIDRISYFYEHENSNVHRAAHELAPRATDAFEGAREKVRSFLNAGSANEIVFVRGTTEAINLVAKSYGEQFLHSGDEIILSHLEHHANIVPWQQLAQKIGLKIRVIPVDDDGQILLGEYQKLLNPNTKL